MSQYLNTVSGHNPQLFNPEYLYPVTTGESSMSTVSNQHNVNPYIAGKSQPLTGQRLLVASFKQTAKMTKAKITALPSVCASIPMFPVLSADQFMQCEPILRNVLCKAQDEIFTARAVATKSTLTSIGDSDLSFEVCFDYLTIAATGGHLTSAKLEAWYDETMADVVGAFTLEKLVATGRLAANADPAATMKMQPIVDATVKQWKSTFTLLASKVQPKELTDQSLTLMVTMLEQVDTGDELAPKLTAKITKWLAPVEVVAIADALDLTAE